MEVFTEAEHQFIYIEQKIKLQEAVIFWPETSRTIEDQLRRVHLGLKPAVLFHKLDSDRLQSLIHGVARRLGLECGITDEGMMVYDQDRQISDTDLKTLDKTTVGTILGYHSEMVPEETENTYALMLKSRDGLEKECVVVSMRSLVEHEKALRKQFEPGDYFEIMPREKFRAQRLARFNL